MVVRCDSSPTWVPVQRSSAQYGVLWVVYVVSSRFIDDRHASLVSCLLSFCIHIAHFSKDLAILADCMGLARLALNRVLLVLRQGLSC